MQRTPRQTWEQKEKELNFVRNHSIKSITEDAEIFEFKTSIARNDGVHQRLMKYTNVEKKTPGYSRK